jgi:GMP synthase (glutamine-hydrolysing)
VICYLDIEHEKALQGAEERARHEAHCADVKRRLEEVSGDVCQVLHYTHLTPQWLAASGVRALIISGNVTDWVEYDEADLHRIYRVIREAELPILGLCGGCQLIAMAHGATVGPIRPLAEGEDDLCDGFMPGYFKEWGFVPMRVRMADLLFDGLGERPVFLAAHYCEVKETPPGFDLLASSDTCRVQVIKRTDKPVYGTQFHPEAYIVGPSDRDGWLVNFVYPGGYSGEQPDGRTLLANFLGCVRL